MSELVQRASPSEEALILNLGDYFHNNDQSNVTPGHKHQLDVDSRFFKVLVTGIQLFQDLIELALQKHDRVRVCCIPGNHDPESSKTLAIALAAFFHSNPRVRIDLPEEDLFFMRWGTTLIGACHGHKMKPERMAMAMSNMRPRDWGESLFRWFVFGHIHHETAKEVGTVRCESFQTIAAKDAYATSHGYVAGHSLNCVEIDRQRGEVGRHRVNVVPNWARKEAA